MQNYKSPNYANKVINMYKVTLIAICKSLFSPKKSVFGSYYFKPYAAGKTAPIPSSKHSVHAP
jgi:hypothetical protein